MAAKSRSVSATPGLPVVVVFIFAPAVELKVVKCVLTTDVPLFFTFHFTRERS
jgi:hypothetical protein